MDSEAVTKLQTEIELTKLGFMGLIFSEMRLNVLF
jgi:hypothetical protein